MIPDETIQKYLRMIFGHSDPGAVLHHLLIASAGPQECDALGLPDPEKLHISMGAIDPGNDAVTAQRMMQAAILHSIEAARREGRTIHFAGLAMEVHTVERDGTDESERLVRQLHADYRLEQHPDAVEATYLYAACRGGGRWTGEHILTGPRAGHISGPDLNARPVGAERSAHQRLVRMAVGLSG